MATLPTPKAPPTMDKNFQSDYMPSIASTMPTKPVGTFLNLYSEARDILNIPSVGTDLSMELTNHFRQGCGVQSKLSMQKRVFQLLGFYHTGSSIVSGSADSRGLVCANWAKEWPSLGVHSVVRTKFVTGISNEKTNTNARWSDAELTKEGDAYAITAKVMRQDKEKIVASASFTQKVTDRFTLGAKAQVDREKDTKAAAFAARYKHSCGTMLGTYTTTGLLSAHCSREVSHYNKPNENNVGLAAQLTYDVNTGQSQTYIGWKFSMPSTKSVVHASINGSGRVKAVLEERMNESTILSLTSEMNHATSDFRFGLGVQVGAKPSQKAAAVQTALKYDPLKVDRWRKWTF